MLKTLVSKQRGTGADIVSSNCYNAFLFNF